MNIYLSSIKQVLHWHIWLRTEMSWRRPTWNRSALEKKISSRKLMTSPFSSWIHQFPIKNCSIYNSTVLFFINLANIWCLYVLWTIFEVNWTLQHQCFLGRGQQQFSRSQILIMGPVWKISQWNLACLLHKYSETSKSNFRGNIKFLLGLWPLEVYSNSLGRQPAPVCPAMGEIRYNTAGNPWQNELEIVDQWSARIPLPHRRGWQWAMGGLQLSIVQNHKAAILKAT